MTARILVLGFAVLGSPLALRAETGVLLTVQVAAVADTTFQHASHGDVVCMECHGMQSQHGTSLVEDVSDCRSCHHTEERVDDDCAECHLVDDMKEEVHTLQRTFVLSVNDDPSDRDLPFTHVAHEERECAECHAEGPSLAVPDLDCQTCHEEHHEATVTGCMNCHEEPPDDAHTLELHETCSGSGCHVESPVENSPRTRVGCLWCHEEQADHEEEGDCATCHFLPAPLAATGGRATSGR